MWKGRNGERKQDVDQNKAALARIGEMGQYVSARFYLQQQLPVKIPSLSPSNV